MNYAIIRTGGKQKKVSEGDVLNVEKLEGEAGAEVVFDDVLLVNSGGDLKVGTPNVDGASVKAKILEQGRDKKIHVFKMKRRKKYRRLQGHRQAFTRVEITAIA
jgi:large subunit ribosomal protein L21